MGDARERVLAATRDCLVERGHGGTTTSEIARRAGVAEGTIFRHFPTKATLLCETAAGVLADVRAVAGRQLEELNGPHRDELHRLARRVLPAELTSRDDSPALVDFVIDGVATIGTARRVGDHVQRLAVLRAAVHALFALPPIAREDGHVVDRLAALPTDTTEGLA